MSNPDAGAPQSPSRAKRLIQTIGKRAGALIVAPSKELAAIEPEAATIPALFRDYVAPLAAIPAVALLLRTLASGMYNPFSALASVVVSYAMSLIGVYLIGETAFQLADHFNARKDRVQAMKLAAYASTPVWLAGVVFLLPPSFDFFFVCSLYALFIAWRGLPILMKTPADKVTGYESTIVCVAMVVLIVLITLGRIIAHPVAA